MKELGYIKYLFSLDEQVSFDPIISIICKRLFLNIGKVIRCLGHI